MSTKEPITLVEIDVPTCSLTYGTAPCTAAVGLTGAIKCFNSIRTCQDRENFTRTVTTLRLARPTQGLPYDALANVASVSVTPPQIDPGKGMGVRATASVKCADHPTGDSLFDKYIADRDYDPFTRGTFWPKFRARFPSIEGAPLRILRGYVGDALADFAAENYFVTGLAIDNDGTSIQAKDALSFCDPKKAQCPLPSTGKLLAALDEDDASSTLSPSGVGDEEYPASGYVCVSNKEILAFTRSGDVLTWGERKAFGSTLQSHDADASVQLVKVYDAQSVADVIYDLLVNFTPGIDAGWCDLPSWQSEADTYIGHLYSAAIPAPTSVQTLINEIAEQAGVSVWGDAASNTIQFSTLRPVAPGATVYDADHTLRDSLRTRDQPKRRMSMAITYYAVANAVEKLDKEPNFKAVELTVDPEADQDYDGIPAIQKNFSRWIGILNRPAAERLNNMQLARFRDPPRDLALQLYATHPDLPVLGEGVFVSSPCLQDETGALVNVPAIVTSVTTGEDGTAYELQELRFADSLVPSSDRNVFIDADVFNVNLRDLYDSLYSSIPYGAHITFYVSPGSWVGSTSPSTPAMTVGDWPEATELVLIIAEDDDADAQILGHGGNGGGYPGATINGEAGSVAIYTRYPIEITNLGAIGGGGGGGAGMIVGSPFTPIGGGGGAGFNGYAIGTTRRGGLPGSGAAHTAATGGGTLSGGDGGADLSGNDGGDGGDLGAGGGNGDGAGTGGAAGAAIDGVSYVTFTDALPGTISGAQIN